jgi:hypothetical protein
VKRTAVADDVFQLVLAPRSFINAYLVGDVVVDAGVALHAAGIVKGLAGHTVTTQADR